MPKAGVGQGGLEQAPAQSRVSAHFWVTFLLCTLYGIIYLDRVNISAAAQVIKSEFASSNTEMGVAFSAFSWAYLASVLFGGWAARKFGARLTLSVCVLIVGAGTVMTGLVNGLMTLFLARIIVGLGEGPAFPAATQAMRNWYPADRFGYIQGITHSASRLGGALAPPVVAVIIVWSGWHTSFLICGVVAILWAAVWALYFKDDPRSHGNARPTVLRGLSITPPDRKARMPIWALTKRMFPVTIVMFTYGWSYWVFVSWLPLYFHNEHHTDLKSSAFLASAPLLAGVFGNAVGGVVSDRIFKKTGSSRVGRCGVVAVSLIGAAVFLIPAMFVTSLTVVVPLLAASMFFLELTIAPMYAVPMDMTHEYAGLGSAYIIMGVAIAGIISPIAFGRLIDLTGNWNVPFATGVIILLIGACVALSLRPDRPFVLPGRSGAN